MDPYPFQIQVTNAVRDALRSGLRRVVLCSATGTGKTVMATLIVQSSLAKGNPIGFICDRTQLVEQTSQKFSDFGVPHGILQGENTRCVDEQFLICSIQTIEKRGIPEYIKTLVIDECHGSVGRKVYTDIMKDRFCVGLTATDYQKGMAKHVPEFDGPLWQKSLVAITIREAINQGFLVDAEIWCPPAPERLKDVKVVAGEYQEDELAQVMNTSELVGNAVQEYLRGPRKPFIAFTVNIAHSQHMVDEFHKAGISCAHVDCYMKPEEKRKIYSDFKNGSMMGLCNCKLISEAADFPRAKVLILDKPVRSRVRLTQMFGRVLRLFEDEKTAFVYDHSGCMKSLGIPWDFEVGVLDDGKPKKSSGSTKKVPKDPTFKECPHCYFMMRTGIRICPKCAKDMPLPPLEIEHSDGELIRMHGQMVKKVPIDKIPPQLFYSQLLTYALDHGYKPTWAACKFKDVHGDWPNGLRRQAALCVTDQVASWICSEQIKWARRRR